MDGTMAILIGVPDLDEKAREEQSAKECTVGQMKKPASLSNLEGGAVEALHR